MERLSREQLLLLYQSGPEAVIDVIEKLFTELDQLKD